MAMRLVMCSGLFENDPSEPGFQGHFIKAQWSTEKKSDDVGNISEQVWYKITVLHPDGEEFVDLWTAPIGDINQNSFPKAGTFRTTEKDFTQKRCIIKVYASRTLEQEPGISMQFWYDHRP